MFMFMTTSITLILTMSCLISISPISLGAIILFLAMVIATQIALTTTGWFGFITFIIYVGGMLVMFAYFSALQPNQHITSMSVTILPLISLMTAYVMFVPGPLIQLNIIPSVTNMFFSYNTAGLLLLGLLLFLALIAVMKTSHASSGPLRPFSYV